MIKRQSIKGTKMYRIYSKHSYICWLNSSLKKLHSWTSRIMITHLLALQEQKRRKGRDQAAGQTDWRLRYGVASTHTMQWSTDQAGFGSQSASLLRATMLLKYLPGRRVKMGLFFFQAKRCSMVRPITNLYSLFTACLDKTPKIM